MHLLEDACHLAVETNHIKQRLLSNQFRHSQVDVLVCAGRRCISKSDDMRFSTSLSTLGRLSGSLGSSDGKHSLHIEPFRVEVLMLLEMFKIVSRPNCSLELPRGSDSLNRNSPTHNQVIYQ